MEAAALTRLVYGNFIRVWREKEAALHESRMKRLLIINLSHEVRTPLNAVTNYLEMALEQDLDRKTKSILQMSHSASKSLIFVIDELLQFTAYKDQPPPALVRVTFDLHLAMREALEPLENQALRKGLDFRINQEIDFPRYVLGDQQRLQQAIANVVVNAIQYTDTGGITVTLRLLNSIPSSSTIEISVQDSGRGMTDQDLDNIFQEFEQVAEDNDGEEDPGQDEDYAKPSTPRNNGRHIGLGLAILARYVKNTGGQIRGRSTPGVGTTFTVEVPLENAIEQRRAENMSEDLSDSEVDFTTPRSTFASIDDPRRPSLTKKYSSSPDIAKRHGGDSGSLYKPPGPSRISREASYESTGSQAGRLDLGGRLRIIVADDNSVNCAILMRRLNKAGHDVKLCRDGQQCVEAFQQDRTGYNFILMDINVSGFPSHLTVPTRNYPSISYVQVYLLSHTLLPSHSVPLGGLIAFWSPG